MKISRMKIYCLLMVLVLCAGATNGARAAQPPGPKHKGLTGPWVRAAVQRPRRETLATPTGRDTRASVPKHRGPLSASVRARVEAPGGRKGSSKIDGTGIRASSSSVSGTGMRAKH